MIPEDNERKGREERGRIIREGSVHVLICTLRLRYDDKEIICEEMDKWRIIGESEWNKQGTI